MSGKLILGILGIGVGVVLLAKKDSAASDDSVIDVPKVSSSVDAKSPSFVRIAKDILGQQQSHSLQTGMSVRDDGLDFFQAQRKKTFQDRIQEEGVRKILRAELAAARSARVEKYKNIPNETPAQRSYRLANVTRSGSVGNRTFTAKVYKPAKTYTAKGNVARAKRAMTKARANRNPLARSSIHRRSSSPKVVYKGSSRDRPGKKSPSRYN